MHEKWLGEMSRIMKEGGIFIFSTHGRQYRGQLTRREEEIFSRIGAFTKISWKKGHRLTTTYNSEESLRKICSKHFVVLDFFDGLVYPEKMGGQDLWVVKKSVH